MKKVCVVCVIVAVMSGCVVLTPEQQADLAEYQKIVQEVDVRLSEYGQRLNAIVQAIREKRIPWTEGKQMILDLKANREKDLALKDRYTKAIEDLRESNVPIGTIVWYTIVSLLTGGGAVGTLVNAWMKRKLGVEIARADRNELHRNTVIHGVEQGCDDLLDKLAELGLDAEKLKDLKDDMPVKAAITEEAKNVGIKEELHTIVREVA